MPKILFYFFLFIAVNTVLPSFAQTKEIDSLKLVLRTAKDDTNKVKALNALCEKLWHVCNYDTSLVCAASAKALAEKLGYKNGMANAFKYAGFNYHDKGDYPEALKNHFASLKIREEMGDKNEIADCYNNIGIIYDDQGNYAGALKNYFVALKIRQEIGDKPGIAACYNNIGIVYDNQGNYTEALKNQLACLEITKETGDKKVTATAYINLGVIYDNQRNYTKALENYFAAMKISEDIQDKYAISAACANIGSLYMVMNKKKEAYLYLNKGLTLAKQIKSNNIIKSNYEFLARLDSLCGNYKSALENYKMFILYHDSLNNEENTRKTIQHQMQYEFDKKESIAKAEQEKKDVITKAEAKRHKVTIYAVTTGLCLIFLLALVILRSLRQNQKKNKIITEQKELVEKQKELVEQKQKEIIASIHYARRIQNSLLPNQSYIDKNLKRLLR
jgi:tetratricopeptide (TPR) repeat protein